MVYKKKHTSGNRMDLVNSKKVDGHRYHARAGMKNDTTSGSLSSKDVSLMNYDEPQKKVYAQGGVKHKAMDDPEFNTNLDKYSKEYGIPKEWVNRLISLESGGDTTAKNPHGTASGLIQMIDSTARGVGTTADDLRKMTASEQLPYAFKYWNNYKNKIKQPTDLYLANMYPAALGKPDDFVLGNNEKLQARIARDNPGMDKDKNGKITVGDVRRWYDPSYKSEADKPVFNIPKLTPNVADKTFTAVPGKTELFPVQRSTLPSIQKSVPIKRNEGIRPASEGVYQEDISPDELIKMYENPDLATNENFVSNLFKSK